MNDHDAIDAIKTVLAECYRTMTPVEVVNEIHYIIGANKIEHEESE